MKASVLANMLLCLVCLRNGLAFLVVSDRILGKLLDDDLDGRVRGKIRGWDMRSMLKI